MFWVSAAPRWFFGKCRGEIKGESSRKQNHENTVKKKQVADCSMTRKRNLDKSSWSPQKFITLNGVKKVERFRGVATPICRSLGFT